MTEGTSENINNIKRACAFLSFSVRATCPANLPLNCITIISCTNYEDPY